MATDGEVNSEQESARAPAMITLRVRVPETKAEKCLQFDPGATVHAAKLRAMDYLGRGLSDKLNYGLYMPDSRGRAGKFLQEERLLSEYPMTGAIGDVELRYKRRIYRNSSLSINKIKRANSNSNLKHFIHALQAGDTTAVNMHLSSGLDPNLPCKSNGATALMLATELKRSREMILTLISGGAFLDFRDAKGLTAMHLAAIIGNVESVQTLLDLGQSPNCLDSRGLTPLYHSILHSGSTVVAEILLYDGSCLAIRDDNGLCEIHQACKLGREHHLELLLTYGVDINGTTTHGNTPLHVSALANQLECARILLRRGADKQIKNYQGNNAEDTALLAGNQRLAELIRDFSQAEVTPIEAKPRLNTRRRRANSGNIGGGQSLSSHNSRGWGSLASVGAIQYHHHRQQQQHQQAGGSQSTVFDRDMSMGRLSVSSSAAAVFGAAAGSNATSRSSIVFSPGQPDSVPVEQLARTVVIQRSATGGFGFVLKGSRVPIPAGWGSIATASRQILGPIDPAKPAFPAGMRQGDLVLEINGVDVRDFSHEQCLELVKGDTLALKLMTPPPQPMVREGHSQSMVSIQSDTEPLKAIDMLDRALNCYEEIPEDPAAPTELVEEQQREEQHQKQPVVAEVDSSKAENSANNKSTTVSGSSEQLPPASAAQPAVTAAVAAAAAVTPKVTPEVAEAPKEDPIVIELTIDEPVDVLPAPEGFGNDAKQPINHINSKSNSGERPSEDEYSQINRKISTIAPLPPRVPPPPPPTAPPPPPPPKPSMGSPSTAASVAVIRRRSLLAKPAAATPDHDDELRRLVELRRRKIDSGQLDPSQKIEAQLNRKSGGSRMVIMPAAANSTAASAASSAPVATETTEIDASAANGSSALAAPTPSPSVAALSPAESNHVAPEAQNNGASSPVQLRRSAADPLAKVADTEAAKQRPSSFTGKAEQLRQLILQQQHQHPHQQHQRHISEL